MSKLNIKQSFQTKKFKYGGYAAASTAVVLAILLIVNLLVGQLNWKIDLTKNKLYSLSDQTTKVLAGLKQDITIYVFDEAGKEDPMLKEIVDKYPATSNKIKLEYKDPVKYPQFAKQYSQNGNDVKQGSIVVFAGSKFKLIDPNDLVNYTYDQSGQPSADSLAVEQKVTSGIIYVTSAESPIVYTLQGHEEAALPSNVTSKLADQNYTVKNLNLAVKDNTLTAGSTLIVVSPKRDLSTDETNTIKDFLSKGGRAIFLMDLIREDLPNFQSLFVTYGVGLKKAIVVEGNASYTAAQNPLYLVPEMASQDITTPLKSSNLPVILPGAQIVEEQKLKKNTTNVVPILTTSQQSWAKTDLNTQTLNKAAGDPTGPFDIAVAVTDKVSDGGKDTKLVLVSNALFMDPQFAGEYGNTDFMVNSVNWLQDNVENISVSPKSLNDSYTTFNSLQALLYSGMVVIVIPLMIAVWGVSVLLRRRRQ